MAIATGVPRLLDEQAYLVLRTSLLAGFGLPEIWDGEIVLGPFPVLDEAKDR